MPLDVPSPVVPVGQWFQIEAFYRNTQDGTGRLTFWLDGRQIVDIANQPMATTPWVEWNACSIGQNLTPSTAVLYIDDCAVSRTRVGPNGIIADSELAMGMSRKDSDRRCEPRAVLVDCAA